MTTIAWTSSREVGTETFAQTRPLASTANVVPEIGGASLRRNQSWASAGQEVEAAHREMPPPSRGRRGASATCRVRIGCVNRRRVLLVAVLVYVGLDLSLPAMPGAFMFDPAGSVKSVDLVRNRPAAEIAVITTPIRDWSVPPEQPPSDVRHRLSSNTEVAPPGWPVVSCLPRATCAPSLPSEDPDPH